MSATVYVLPLSERKRLDSIIAELTDDALRLDDEGVGNDQRIAVLEADDYAITRKVDLDTIKRFKIVSAEDAGLAEKRRSSSRHVEVSRPEETTYSVTVPPQTTVAERYEQIKNYLLNESLKALSHLKRPTHYVAILSPEDYAIVREVCRLNDGDTVTIAGFKAACADGRTDQCIFKIVG